MLNQNEVTAKRKPVAAKTELRHGFFLDVSPACVSRRTYSFI
jgi:hypothetical protein